MSLRFNLSPLDQPVCFGDLAARDLHAKLAIGLAGDRATHNYAARRTPDRSASGTWQPATCTPSSSCGSGSGGGGGGNGSGRSNCNGSAMVVIMVLPKTTLRVAHAAGLLRGPGSAQPARQARHRSGWGPGNP